MTEKVDEWVGEFVPHAVLPYQRKSYDPKDEGLAGIQWDSAVLFQISCCKTRGDYDAFKLEKVSY